MTTHGPVLPVWTCAGCGRAWPCAIRRRELQAEYFRAPASLRLYLASCYLSASQDLSWASAGALRRRFFGWLP
jgi:hypothetical protein